MTLRRLTLFQLGNAPDAEGVEGMSASKMRKAAAEDDFLLSALVFPMH